jgi:hypothetical protein
MQNEKKGSIERCHGRRKMTPPKASSSCPSSLHRRVRGQVPPRAWATWPTSVDGAPTASGSFSGFAAGWQRPAFQSPPPQPRSEAWAHRQPTGASCSSSFLSSSWSSCTQRRWNEAHCRRRVMKGQNLTLWHGRAPVQLCPAVWCDGAMVSHSAMLFPPPVGLSI